MLTEQPHRTVVFSHYDTEMTYLIPPTGPIRFTETPDRFIWFRTIVNHRIDPLLIADSLLPPTLPFFTLVISSPAHLSDRILSDRLKGYYPPRYVPVPTEAEVLAMHQVAFKELDLDGVRRRMQLWGPIPRDVLVRVSSELQRIDVQRCSDVKLETIAKAARCSNIGEVASGDTLEALQRVLHERAAGQDAEPGSPAADMHSSRYYAHGKVVFATPSWLRLTVQRILDSLR